MAVGRISGPLLKPNLIRNGIDLAFETDLLYLDVNNQKIGIKNDSPNNELSVNGKIDTTQLQSNIAEIGNVILENNTISTIVGNLNLKTPLNDTINFENNVIIGTDNQNTVFFNSFVSSDIVPVDNDSTGFNLGTESNPWTSLFLNFITVSENQIETKLDSNLILKTTGSGDIVLDSGNNGVIDATSTRVVNVADPINTQDAATKAYVNTSISNIRIRDLADVDSTLLEDGAVFVYNTAANKFITQLQLDKQLINGGNF
jgi:hypothetical protein